MSLFGLRINVLLFIFLFYLLGNVLFNLGLSRTLADVLAVSGFLLACLLLVNQRLHGRG